MALPLVAPHSGVARYGTLLMLAGEGLGEVGKVGDGEGGGRADYGRKLDEADHAGAVVVLTIPDALLPFPGFAGSCVSECFPQGSEG